MTSTPRATVIIPTYNRASYLPITLDTLTHQIPLSPSPRKERGPGGEVTPTYELILVDDGSTDATRDAIAPHLGCNVRYECIAHAGLPGPINRGLELARGEYVMLANDHDLYAPKALAALTDALDRHPSAALAVSDVVLVTPDATREIATYPFPYGGLVEGRRFLVEQLLPGIGSIASCNLFRRDALGCELLDSTYGAGSDVELWLRLASRGDVVHIPQTLVRVRDRDPSSEYFLQNHELVRQTLRAKRAYMPPDLDAVLRRGIEAGWRRRVDKSAAVSLWRALEARHQVPSPSGRGLGRGPAASIRDFAHAEGTRPGALAIDALTRLPSPLALAVLRTARRLWGEQR